MEFTGKITQINDVRSGTTTKEWASVSFEVTEEKDEYPQVALFDYFKNGDHVKYARDFNDSYKVGDVVKVEFNLKKQVYQKKDGSGEAAFYSTPAWKIDKQESDLPFD